jgi:hypothetical protein
MTLRVAVLLEGSDVPSKYAQWICKLVPLSELIEFTFVYQTKPTQRKYFVARERGSHRLWAWLNLDKPRQAGPIPLDDLLKAYCRPTTLELSPVEFPGGRAVLTEEDLVRLRSLDFDYIIRAGYGLLGDSLLKAAAGGVLSYHYGDKRKYRGSPPLFWEMYYGEQMATAEVQLLGSRIDSGVTLGRVISPISYRSSYSANLLMVYEASSSLMMEVLARLVEESGIDFVLPNESGHLGTFRSVPTDSELLRFQLRTFWRRISSFVRPFGNMR